jgi:hypothetical protein
LSCSTPGAATNIIIYGTNKKFLWGPGAVFSKRAPGRRRQEEESHRSDANQNHVIKSLTL